MKLCLNCKWSRTWIGAGLECGHPKFTCPSDGSPKMLCENCRDDYNKYCGKDGKYWEKKGLVRKKNDGHATVLFVLLVFTISLFIWKIFL